MNPWYWLLITPIVLLALDLVVSFIRYARAKQRERGTMPPRIDH